MDPSYVMTDVMNLCIRSGSSSLAKACDVVGKSWETPWELDGNTLKTNEKIFPPLYVNPAPTNAQSIVRT